MEKHNAKLVSMFFINIIDKTNRFYRHLSHFTFFKSVSFNVSFNVSHIRKEDTEVSHRGNFKGSICI